VVQPKHCYKIFPQRRMIGWHLAARDGLILIRRRVARATSSQAGGLEAAVLPKERAKREISTFLKKVDLSSAERPSTDEKARKAFGQVFPVWYAD